MYNITPQKSMKDFWGRFLFYRNRSLFGIFAIYFFLSFSKKAIESLEKPCPFQVEVLVMRIQH